MSAKAIKAGAAFVEMWCDDERVKRTLAGLKVKLQAFGATVDALGTQSFAAMNAGASTALAATVGSTAAATTGASIFAKSINSVTASFSRLWKMATGSVGGMAASFIGLGAAMKKLLPANHPLRNILDGFMAKSQTTEALGRFIRFFGAVSGSSVISGLGRTIERAGMGASVAKAFNDKGVGGAITAWLGAGFRSAKGAVGGFVASSIAAPFRAGLSVLNGTAAASVSSIAKVATATSSAGAAMALAAAPTRGFAGALTSVARGFSKILGVAGGVVKIAGAISAAGAVAAGGFAASAGDIIAKAKETGKSIQQLIQEKYGKFSFITPADIKAGHALSESMKALKQQTSAAFAQLGIAAMPVLKKAVEFMTDATRAVTRFMAENRQLIGTAVAVAGRVAKIAGAISLVGFALPTVGAAVAALMNPTTLFVGALTAIAVSFPQVRQAGMDALGFLGTLFQSALKSATDFFNYIFPNFNEVGSVVSQTIQGVLDALQGGSFQLAGEVAMAGLKVAWLAGTEQLRVIYRQLMTDIALITEEGLAKIKIGWTIATEFIGNMWQATSTVATAALEQIVAKTETISAAWNGIRSVTIGYFEILGKGISTAMQGVYEAIDFIKPIWENVVSFMSELWESLIGRMKSSFSSLTSFIPATLSTLGKIHGEAFVKSIPGASVVATALKAQQEMSKEGFKQEQKDRAESTKSHLDAIDAAHRERMKAILDESVAADKAAKDDLEAARKKLEELKWDAQYRKEFAIASNFGKAQDGENAAKKSSGLISGFGSFSAAAASRIGVAGLGTLEDLAKQTVDGITKTNDLLEKGKGLGYT